MTHESTKRSSSYSCIGRFIEVLLLVAHGKDFCEKCEYNYTWYQKKAIYW